MNHDPDQNSEEIRRLGVEDASACGVLVVIWFALLAIAVSVVIAWLIYQGSK